MLQKICLIIPYFGHFDSLFPIFLNSCRNNPTVDWLIITDDRTQFDYPKNVKVVYSSFNNLVNQIQRNFDFTITLNRPYKLCDFKPAYGIIFKDYLKGYDFWGHCDTDMIFGDIRSILTSKILMSYDKILSRGHLSLYRNNDFMNNFFRTNTGEYYKEVFTNDRNFIFDERGAGKGMVNHLMRDISTDNFWDEIPFDDLSTLESNFVPAQKRNDSLYNIIYNYNGKDIVKYALSGEEMVSIPVLYVHFQKRKLKIETENYNQFTIIPNKIIPNIEPSIRVLKKYGRKKIFNKQYFKIKFSNLKRKLKKL